MHLSIFENFFKDLDIDFLKENVKIFFEKKLKKLINPQVEKFLNYHLMQNDYVILMSSSPDFIVTPLAEILEIKNFFSTKYLISQKKKINDIEIFLDGKSKAKIIEKILKKNKSCSNEIIGFSDSIDDLPLLKVCDLIYLVNPNKTLIKKLKQKKCKII